MGLASCEVPTSSSLKELQDSPRLLMFDYISTARESMMEAISTTDASDYAASDRGCASAPPLLHDRGGSIERLCATPLFLALPERVREVVLDRTQFRNFVRGDVLAWEGQHLAHLVVVLDGFMKLSVSQSNGRSKVVGVVGAGVAPYWPDTLHGRPLSASLIGLQSGVIAKVPLAPIRHGISSYAHFAFIYAEQLADWIAVLEEQLVVTRAATVPERLAGLLGFLLKRCGDVDTGVIPANLSRQELAEAAGTTPETVIRLLSKWEKASILEKPPGRGLRIRDLAALERLAQGLVP